ncbi:hypothetical protein AMTRI_Chr09g39050 [Amborella trichopoda]
MQQQQHPMQAVVPPIPIASITTEHIQKVSSFICKLIMYQNRLQKNLMYLAAIADAQPQSPPVHPQMPPHATMQPSGPYIQHQQTGQQPIFTPKVPIQFTPQQMQEQQLHHQLQQQLHSRHPQMVQGPLSMRPVVTNGMQMMHGETMLVANNNQQPGMGGFAQGGASSGSMDGAQVSRGFMRDVQGNKQEVGSEAAIEENNWNSGSGHCGKGAEEGAN